MGPETSSVVRDEGVGVIVRDVCTDNEMDERMGNE